MAQQPVKKPINGRQDTEGPAAKGFLFAPFVPRRYLDKRVETTIPRFLVLTRAYLMLLALVVSFAAFFVFAEQYRIALYDQKVSFIFAGGVVFLHIILFVYAAVTYHVYYGESKRGAYMMSRKAIAAFGTAQIKFLLLIIASAGAYWLVCHLYLNKYLLIPAAEFYDYTVETQSDKQYNLANGLLLLTFINLLANVFIMRFKMDTLAVFTEDYWISGTYKVYMDDVGGLRVFSRAGSGIFANPRSEKKVYFEVYDKSQEYMGRDCIWETDYDDLEKTVKKLNPLKKGEVVENRLPVIRTAQKKKKKNPYKKK